ncbi:hypothetical protein [Methanolobus vulcani]|uniref:hypothetical protein n=1 Tax=Methanolobus vulcani TaxID=38026 RepID=UPI000B863679|nr:hypothetical protein [Methanolobus vulcani]
MEIKYQVPEPGWIFIPFRIKDQKTQYSGANAVPLEIITAYMKMLLYQLTLIVDKEVEKKTRYQREYHLRW